MSGTPRPDREQREPVSGSSEELSDHDAVERAAGVLMARGFDGPAAIGQLEEDAERVGRSASDVARETLAQPLPALGELFEAYAGLYQAITAVPVERMPHRVAELAVQRVRGAKWASLTFSTKGGWVTAGATHPVAEAADRLQYDLHDGPSVDDGGAPGGPVVIDDLGTDRRWPAFSVACEGIGVRSLLVLRLDVEADDRIRVASLNIYADAVEAFDNDAETVGILLATHASTALVASRYRMEQLERALENSREIGAAIGILMQRFKITEARAFDLLRVASQHANRKLHDIAADLVHTGIL